MYIYYQLNYMYGIFQIKPIYILNDYYNVDYNIKQKLNTVNDKLFMIL